MPRSERSIRYIVARCHCAHRRTSELENRVSLRHRSVDVAQRDLRMSPSTVKMRGSTRLPPVSLPSPSRPTASISNECPLAAARPTSSCGLLQVHSPAVSLNRVITTMLASLDARNHLSVNRFAESSSPLWGATHSLVPNRRKTPAVLRSGTGLGSDKSG